MDNFRVIRMGIGPIWGSSSLTPLSSLNSDNYRLDKGGRGSDGTPTPSYLIASARGVNLWRSKTVTKKKLGLD